MELINEFIKHLEGEYKIIDSYNCNIKPCVDCRYCWKNTGCCINDEMQDVYNYIQECDNILIASPHATPELDVIIKNLQGEYVCYAGMWMVPENNLAYLEPLCTVPEDRKIGIASAALSELYRRTASRGATHMTGGGNEFYFVIGYEPIVKWSVWKKLGE